MNLTFISYNVASSSTLSGINQLLALFNPLMVFLQEVMVDTEQLNAQINGKYEGISNIDPLYPSKPGNAVIWKREIEVNVVNVVPLRLQYVSTKSVGNFVNVYAQTGTQGEWGRRSLFREDLIPLIKNSLNSNSQPLLFGD